MGTQMRGTSLEAYFGEVVPKLSQMQSEVLRVFYDNPTLDLTNMELSEELGWSINRVTPRTYELRGQGKNSPLKPNPILIESRQRPCRVTGNTAWAWSLNPDRNLRRSEARW